MHLLERVLLVVALVIVASFGVVRRLVDGCLLLAREDLNCRLEGRNRLRHGFVELVDDQVPLLLGALVVYQTYRAWPEGNSRGMRSTWRRPKTCRHLPRSTTKTYRHRTASARPRSTTAWVLWSRAPRKRACRSRALMFDSRSSTRVGVQGLHRVGQQVVLVGLVRGNEQLADDGRAQHGAFQKTEPLALAIQTSLRVKLE